MTEEITILSHPAKLRQLNESEISSLREMVGSEAGQELYFFRAEISNDQLDSHFTHMSQKTLANYAEDASRGVAFLKGHNWRELPIGYSLTGLVENVGRQRVVADFYTVAGLPDTNDLILRMKANLVRDVSVGFHGGREVCDICGQEFWDCRHFPGLKYEEKIGDTVKTVLATFTIDDSRLSEVSGVFDGSTPDAMILKAQRAAKAGDLTQQQIELLEQRYRVALPHKTVRNVAQPISGGKKMDERQEARLISLLVDGGVIPTDQRDTMDSEGVLLQVGGLIARTKALESQAKDGAQYRADLVKEALEEGVRAHGNEFDKAMYEATLNASTLTVVKRMRDDWKKTADKMLPAGRSSTESGEEPPKRDEEPVRSFVPDSAYR